MNGQTHIDVKLARDVLVTVVQAYCRAMMAAMPDTRKVLSFSRKLRSHVRDYRRIQITLRARARREALAANAGLRRRVQFDLGGTIAMVKWDRRRRRAQISIKARQARQSRQARQAELCEEPALYVYHHPSKRPIKARKPWVPKTDRTEIYRLASIPAGGVTRIVKRPKVKTRIVKRKSNIIERPLEVTTDELRISQVFAVDYPSGFYHKFPSSGHAPPIDRPPIH